MSLTKEFIEHALPSLGKHAREALKEINDPALTERTLVYKNLREVGRLNGQKDSDIIAKTICDILDTRAWEDFVDVDGTRRSCESFAKWLELHGLDIQLAEFVVKEKRNDKYGAFLEAKDGKLLSTAEKTQQATNARWPQSGDVSAMNGSRKPYRSETSRWRLRLEREAPNDPKAAEFLEQIVAGKCAITTAAKAMGWASPSIRGHSQAVVSQLLPQAKPIIKALGVTTEDFVKAALEEYIQNHPEFTDD